MNRVFCIFILTLAFGCTTTQTESTSADSTVVELDTVEISGDVLPSDEITEKGMLNEKNEYVILNQGGFVSSPFSFSLDTATVSEMLGTEANITSIYTEGGTDSEGSEYSGYTYFTVNYQTSDLKFYDYTGKHFANIYTPAIPLSDSIVVGMTKQRFLEKMQLDGDEAAKEAEVFSILDDYGQVKFTFKDGTLFYIYIYYEEGD